MAEPLTQAEIDALLNSLKDSTSSSASSQPEEAIAPAPLTVFGELTSDTTRRLTAIAESFAKAFERGLKPHLELPLRLTIKQLGLVTQASRPLAFLRFSADERVGAIDFEPKIAMAMADRLMGGQARPAPGRPGKLETSVLTPVFQEAANAMSYALRNQGQLVSTFHDEELELASGLQVDFELNLHGFSGGMSFLIPNFFPALEQVEEAEPVDGAWIVELGGARMTAQTLLALKVGDIVKLDRHADADLILNAGGVKFSGRPVLDGQKLMFSVAAREELN